MSRSYDREPPGVSITATVLAYFKTGPGRESYEAAKAQLAAKSPPPPKRRQPASGKRGKR